MPESRERAWWLFEKKCCDLAQLSFFWNRIRPGASLIVNGTLPINEGLELLGLKI